MNKFELQSGDASEVKRYDSKYSALNWKVVLSAGDKGNLLMQIIEALNEGELDTENCFFRLVDTETKEAFIL